MEKDEKWKKGGSSIGMELIHSTTPPTYSKN
jgi:hypothetical protein